MGGDAGVYTDWRKRTLDAVLGHLCTLLRREDRASRRWGRRSVHRLAKMAPRSRFGAFVYTVGLWAWVVGGLGIAIVYTNGRIGPLGAVSGRLCTLLVCCAVVDSRGDATVYTDRLKRPLRAVLGHLCTLLRRELRRESRYESRRELRQVARAPQPPWRAGGAPRWPLSLDREDRLRASGAAARLASSPRRQPTRTPEEPPNVVFDYRIRPSLRHGLTRPKMCCPFVERGHRSHAYQRHTPPHQ